MFSNFKTDLAKSTNTTYYPALNLKNKELVLKLFQSSWPLKIDRKTKRKFKQKTSPPATPTKLEATPSCKLISY